ncbi:MAG TPA: hypothetical protein VEY06_01635 [Flavisolibacter sp.]|jgi:hypothetical protein|nr:hypothetical protein [Flavisolibacter sp.]
MPTHFHFLVYTDERSCNPVTKALIATQHLTEGIRLLLSSFSKGINKQEQTTGNVFQQKTKAKCVAGYDHIAFHYIHQNAFTAGLVQQMEKYEFSSFPDYVNMRNGTLCDKALAFKLLELKEDTFYSDSYKMLEAGSIGKIF